MKGYVITIMDNPRSVESAERCIESAKRYNFEVEMWKATTPEDNPEKILEEKEILLDAFDEIYSRKENCMAAFLSHYSLWEKSVRDHEQLMVLEHDAFFVNYIPNINSRCINMGKPSYGKFNYPIHIGEGPLVSKKYFGGAHAYAIKPAGAKVLIHAAETRAKPTDLFLDARIFPDIQEYYPWPVEARDSFSTIQNRNGCVAKHNYNEQYEIL